jgi:hypothetical protein
MSEAALGPNIARRYFGGSIGWLGIGDDAAFPG